MQFITVVEVLVVMHLRLRSQGSANAAAAASCKCHTLSVTLGASCPAGWHLSIRPDVCQTSTCPMTRHQVMVKTQ